MQGTRFRFGWQPDQNKDNSEFNGDGESHFSQKKKKRMPNLQILMWEVVASHDSLYPKEIWHLQKKNKNPRKG